MKQDKKMIATAYIHLVKDNDGNIEKVYGYDINKAEVSLDDIETLISFLGKLKRKAEDDFDDRVDISEHQFKVDIEGDSDVPME